MTEKATVPKCTSWLGHKFEARYSTEPAGRFKHEAYEGSAAGLKVILDAFQRHTYERDVCVRCGVAVEKHIEMVQAPEAS